MLTKDLATTLLDKVMRFLEKGRVPDELPQTADKIGRYDIGSEWRSSYESILDKKESTPLREYNSNAMRAALPDTKIVKSAEVSR